MRRRRGPLRIPQRAWNDEERGVYRQTRKGKSGKRKQEIKPTPAKKAEEPVKQEVKPVKVKPTYEEEIVIPRVDEKTLEKYPYLVAIVEDKIVGYAYAGTYIGRAACDWSVETSIYVDMEYKGRGIGGRLYTELEDILRKMNILNLNAAIASPQVEDEHLTMDSINFHKHMGYTVVGEFHNCGYKFGRWYKLMWMEKMLGEHTLSPKPVVKYSEI